MQRAREALPSIYLLLCLLLGGSTSGGAIANAGLQLAGIALVLLVLVSGKPLKFVRTERHLILIGAGILLIGFAQLIPVPPSLWTRLGGRDEVAQGFTLMRTPMPWLPVSLWPAATVSALVAIIPGFAIIILIVFGGQGSLRLFTWSLIVLTAISFLIGFGQLAGGQQSSLYFYQNTNRDQLVGFFANSNHLATLGTMALPFLAALAARDTNFRRDVTRSTGSYATMAFLGGFIILGVVADGSIAGILLLLPSIAGSFAILRAERARIAFPIIAGVILVSAATFVLIAFYSPLVNGFGATDLSVGARSRADIFARTLVAIRSFFPSGSGLGSFLLVYPTVADNASATSVYINHAHSDLLEFLLEAGVAGAGVLAVFAIWWSRQVFFAWRDGGPRARFARAASVASALLMMHSLVDYPLRTTAITVLFAACCAMIARPLSTLTANTFAEGDASRRSKMVHADG